MKLRFVNGAEKPLSGASGLMMAIGLRKYTAISDVGKERQEIGEKLNEKRKKRRIIRYCFWN